MNLLENFGIKFKNPKLLEEALTHSSYANQNNTTSYEKLEFLGDAVLQLTVSTFLFENYEKLKEGELTKKRKDYVRTETLAKIAQDIGVLKHIRVAKKTEVSINILADVFEAIIGAIYLDQDIEAVYELLDAVLLAPSMDSKFDMTDYKSELQELVQAEARTLEYQIVEESGPSHDKNFVAVVIMEGIVMGRGSGKKKQDAEQQAAKDALTKRADIKKHQK